MNLFPTPPVSSGPTAPGTIRHVQIMLDSFARLLGRELVPREGSAAEQAERLFHAPFVVVSHGVERDPVLNYGNAAALALWETEWSELTRTPSRLTAEPVHRDERARLLARTRDHGFVDDYSGIRISRTGRRFRIERAIVWNLASDDGVHRGQAATFREWTPLSDGGACADRGRDRGFGQTAAGGPPEGAPTP